MKRLPLFFLLLLPVSLFAQDPSETIPTLYISASAPLTDSVEALLSKRHFRFVVVDQESAARMRLEVTASTSGKQTILRAQLKMAQSSGWSTPGWSYTEKLNSFSPDRAADDVVKALGVFTGRLRAQQQARARSEARLAAAAQAPAGPAPDPQPISQPLCCGNAFVVEASSWVIAWQGVLTESAQDAHLVGTYSASGGSGNDIVVVVADPINLQNALSGHPAQVLYESDKLSAGTIDVPLPGPGAYAIAFTNRFSLVSAKLVTADLSLAYTPAR